MKAPLTHPDPPFEPRHIRKFFIRLADDITKSNSKSEEVFRIPDEYVPIMREHYRKVVQMPVDDPAFVAIGHQVKSQISLFMWCHVLFQFNTEGLLTAPNLCEFVLQGMKHAEVLADKPIQALTHRLDDCEKYVVMREALADMTVLLELTKGSPEEEVLSGDLRTSFDELKAVYLQAKADWKEEFGLPWRDEWNSGFSSENLAVRLFAGEETERVFDERLDALRERDDKVDEVTLPWAEDMHRRQEEFDRSRRIKEAEDRRLQKLAERQARREARAREAEIAQRKAEEERVTRTRQPPLHPDLADAIEMVNIVDTADRIAALRDLRETALAITLEDPQDQTAEHWASWAKEQMRLARRPDTEWSIIDGQFRMARPEPPSAGRGN